MSYNKEMHLQKVQLPHKGVQLSSGDSWGVESIFYQAIKNLRPWMVMLAVPEFWRQGEWSQPELHTQFQVSLSYKAKSCLVSSDGIKALYPVSKTKTKSNYQQGLDKMVLTYYLSTQEFGAKKILSPKTSIDYTMKLCWNTTKNRQ